VSEGEALGYTGGWLALLRGTPPRLRVGVSMGNGRYGLHLKPWAPRASEAVSWDKVVRHGDRGSLSTKQRGVLTLPVHLPISGSCSDANPGVNRVRSASGAPDAVDGEPGRLSIDEA
jgi:hypothetical protein